MSLISCFPRNPNEGLVISKILTLWRHGALLLLLWVAQTAVGQDTKRPPLEFSKWSGDINVPDPVAVSVDDQGRVFVTQTRRRKIQDLDIRQHKEWTENDLSLTSVEAKRDFYHSVLKVGGEDSLQKKHVRDWNEDGVHDWRDLTVVSEAIYRLVDQDGDAKADEITVFAEGFQTEVTGVAAGVLAHGDAVYATVAPDVWRLEDENQDGKADYRNVIAHGFGLHIAYGGHDMHGLTIGPDGKLYWSIGDKGIHVETPDGTVHHYPHEGGVMRCNLDGTDFEVFAHGLRNVQEFAFDQYGNMFGVDNDSDQATERERFVYIVNRMDAGWRCYYQYRGDSYNPWTAERLWEVAGQDHPAYIVPPIRYYIDGPAGFKFNPGTALSKSYQDYFFLTGAPNGTQHAFRIEPNGDSFEMVDEHSIGKGIAIVGLAFGPDGALYGADWDGGYPLDQKGSVTRIDVSQAERHPLRAEVQELLRNGFRSLETKVLLKLLEHADQRIRMRAQFELVQRDQGLSLAALAQNESAQVVTRLHAIWGLGQLARAGDTLARDSLALVIRDEDRWIQGQAAKTYGEVAHVNPEPLLRTLKAKDAYVKTLGCLAIARHPTEKAVEQLLELSDSVRSDQHYLRHGVCAALAACASETQLAEQAKSDNLMMRMCCVLALRKQGSALVAKFLQDQSTWVATEAARAIHDGPSIPDALPQLAAALDSATKDEAYFRRALNANYRLGGSDEFKRVLKALQSEIFSEDQKQTLFSAIGEWAQPGALDRVEGIYRPELANSPPRKVDKQALAPVLESFVLGSDSSLKETAMRISQKTEVAFSLASLVAILRDTRQPAAARAQALRLLAQRQEQLLEEARNSEVPELRLEALRLSASGGKRSAVESLLAIVRSPKRPLAERQRAIRILADSDGSDAELALVQLGEQLVSKELDARIQLDVADSLRQVGSTDARFAKFAETLQKEDAEDALGKYRLAIDGGDVDKGEKLFRTHGQAQCARCHRIGPKGSNIGPELTTVGKQRDRAYLLRALITPSSEMEPKYRTQSILLESDEVIQGRIQSEAEDKLVVAKTTGEVVELDPAEVVVVKDQETSLMPSMKDLLTPAEVRDVVTFLKSLQ